MTQDKTPPHINLDERNQNNLAKGKSVTKCNRLKMVAEDGKMRVTALLNDTEVASL